MTIYYQGFLGGESQDALVDGYRPVTDWSLPSGWTPITSPIKTGVGALSAASGASGLGCASLAAANNLFAGLVWVNCDGNPTTPAALAGIASVLPATYYFIEMGTDRKIRVVSRSNGWANRVPLTGWSTNAIPSGSWGHLICIVDGITLGSDHVWLAVLLDPGTGTYTQEFALDLGSIGTSFFNLLPASAAFGVALRFDDLVGLQSSVAGDAPHLTAWPLAQVHRQLAIGETAADSWWKNPAKDNAEYTEWDETTGDDGDTTYNWQDASAGTDKYQRSDGQTEATVGITGHTMIQGLQVSGLNSGPAINLVHRTVSGTKWGGVAAHNLGADIALGNPGSTYVGLAACFFRSSGSWTVADLTSIEFGTGIYYGASHDMAWRVTMCMMQWLTYVSTLPLTSTPTLAGGGRSWATIF